MRLRINRDGVWMTLGCATTALLFLLAVQGIVFISLVDRP